MTTPSTAGDEHTFLSFFMPDGDRWMIDATFLASSWTCIFGRGCPGILDAPSPERGEGCCSYGAHFTGEEDSSRVLAASERLTAEQWQHRDEALHDGPFAEEDGATVSKLVDDACIFLNTPEFAGGGGCALHIAAEQAGEDPIDWKPEVCWQLPLRYDSADDDNERTTHFLRQWDRADWGEGGEEFHWWCTEGPEAFVAEDPVYRTMRNEIVALVGEDVYARITELLERPREQPLPHPSIRRRS